MSYGLNLQREMKGLILKMKGGSKLKIETLVKGKVNGFYFFSNALFFSVGYHRSCIHNLLGVDLTNSVLKK